MAWSMFGRGCVLLLLVLLYVVSMLHRIPPVVLDTHMSSLL